MIHVFVTAVHRSMSDDIGCFPFSDTSALLSSLLVKYQKRWDDARVRFNLNGKHSLLPLVLPRLVYNRCSKPWAIRNWPIDYSFRIRLWLVDFLRLIMPADTYEIHDDHSRTSKSGRGDFAFSQWKTIEDTIPTSRSTIGVISRSTVISQFLTAQASC